MLSIGNGKAQYYAELAQRDEYYQTGIEAPGLWHGQGAKEFGLSGEVAAQVFYKLADGYDPRSAEKLKLVRQAGTKRRRALWDFTFSAPKGLSVWWGMTDGEMRERISACHLRAVTQVLDYIEEMGLVVTRQGKSGKEIPRCHKLIWALYEHCTTRAQDVELHTHATLINVGFNADGKTRTLDPVEAVRSKMMLGAAYRANLSRELQREFGVEVERLPKGMFDIKGVPEGLKAEHSTRRRQILDAMEAEGFEGAKAASTFVLTTRQVKQHRPRTELFQEWAERGEKYGLNEREIIGRREFAQPTHSQVKEMAKRVISAMTKDKAYFTERFLLRGLAIEAQYNGAGFALCRAVAAEYLDKEAVYLRTEKDQKLYTTPEIDQLEKRMLSQVVDGRNKEFPALRKPRQVDLADLSEEQRHAVEHLTDSRGNIKIVSGMAGAGKTRTLRSACEVWESQGYAVRGVALAAIAAQGVETEAGIRSKTIAKLFYSIDNPTQEDSPQLDNRTILVVDEAGMVDTLKMARLVDEIEKTGARLVLVGDAEQLQPVEHGAPFKTFGHILGRSELREIRRQREEWQREAVHDFADGRAIEGLTKYHERGLLTITEKRTDAVEQLVRAWSRNPNEYEDKVMIASTRATVEDLNRLGQRCRIERSELGSESIKANGYEFHAGDRILFRQNDRRVGVLNGERATIEEIDRKDQTIVVSMDGGELRIIPLERYEKIQLGYAFTTHSLQGATRESSYVLVGGYMQDKELSYVQMSRHKSEAHIFAATEDVGHTLETMAEIMNRSRQKELAQEKRENGLETTPATNQQDGRETARSLRRPSTKQQRRQPTQATLWSTPALAEENTRGSGRRQENREHEVETAPAATRQIGEATSLMEGRPATKQQRQQPTRAASGFASIFAEDQRRVVDVLRALERIAGITGEMRQKPQLQIQERAEEIRVWVQYGRPIADKVGLIPSMPLDAKIKSTLIEAFSSLNQMAMSYEHRQGHREYVVNSMAIAHDALIRVKPDLPAWKLARSAFVQANGNFRIIEKIIEQGGQVEKLRQDSENTLSVFTIRNLPGTFTAQMDGLYQTSMGFEDRIRVFGQGDPPDNHKITEIDYDPVKIRTAQIREDRAQARQIERGQEQSRDGGGYGPSR